MSGEPSSQSTDGYTARNVYIPDILQLPGSQPTLHHNYRIVGLCGFCVLENPVVKFQFDRFYILVVNRNLGDHKVDE